MENYKKSTAASLVFRIIVVFILAVIIVISVSYIIVSENFHSMMTDYTIKLIDSMCDQGVSLIEADLANNRQTVTIIANTIALPESTSDSEKFNQDAKTMNSETFLRMVYLTNDAAISTDGRSYDVDSLWQRSDIVAAFAGETSVYGPYFNERDEFIVCYSAPVVRNGETIGVLTIEKDGYRYCDLIADVRFVNTGECYIIDAAGTDIAVSDHNHIDWVNSRYNAQKIFAETGDKETEIIMNLEQKGLDGNSGIGTYYWNDGLCYLVYKPIKSTGWVFLTGLREEEINALTNTTLMNSFFNSQTLLICLGIIVVLSAIVVFWVVSGMRNNAKINEKLETIANHDALTGLLNRRFYDNTLTQIWKNPGNDVNSASVFIIDIDNFKSYNDCYGHPQGDECLRKVAKIFNQSFDGYNYKALRYGGEEFVATVFGIDRKTSKEISDKICRKVEDEKIPDARNGVVTVSVGVCCVKSTEEISLFDCLDFADKALYEAKLTGKNRSVLFDNNKIVASDSTAAVNAASVAADTE